MLKLVSFFFVLLFVLAACERNSAVSEATTPSFDSVFVRANSAKDSGYIDKALNIVFEAHSNSENLTLGDEVSYYNYINIIFNDLKDYDRSVAISDSMLAILSKARNSKTVNSWRTVAYNAKADALFNKGKYNEAYNNYFKAQRMAKESSDSCSMRTYSYRLAMTLYKQMRFQEAAEQFKQAYGESFGCMTEDFNLFYFKQEVLDNIGLCYSAMHKYDSAIIYYDSAIAYIDSRTGKFKHKLNMVYESAKAVVYGNLADVYLNNGNLDSAKKLYRQSISINLQKGYANTDAVITQSKLADVYFSEGDLPAMKRALDSIRSELDSVSDKRAAIAWNKQMWQYYARKKDSAKAYGYLYAYFLENQQYQSDNKDLMATDFASRVKDIERQYNITMLEKNRERQTTLLVIAVAAVLMAFMIVLLVLRDARRSKATVIKLKALNDTIKEQKDKLEEAFDQLHERDKDKTRILKSVAHDIMSPISAIIALTEMLQDDPESVTEEQRELFNLIKEACNNSLKLSRDILEAASQVSSLDIKAEWADINKIVLSSVDLLTPRASAKGQHIKVEWAAEQMKALVNKDKMWRVVNNLLGNAIKFSYEGGNIYVKIEHILNMVRVSIKDEGIGISEANKPHIFDMFTEAKMLGTAGETPHGLGLSISLQIAKAHNGNIWFESEKGKGSTFYLEFPVQ